MKNIKDKLFIVSIVLILFLVLLMAFKHGEQANQINDLQKENEELQSKIDTFEKNNGGMNPCPFCGSTDVEINDIVYYQGECNNCHFRAPVLLDENGHVDTKRNTKIDAINYWNSITVNQN